jgi:hypothetical protein
MKQQKEFSLFVPRLLGSAMLLTAGVQARTTFPEPGGKDVHICQYNVRKPKEYSNAQILVLWSH